MDISTNPNPTICRNLYENTGAVKSQRPHGRNDVMMAEGFLIFNVVIAHYIGCRLLLILFTASMLKETL